MLVLLLYIAATAWGYQMESVKLRNTHTNIATYTNQKPPFNTVIQKLQKFDTSSYKNEDECSQKIYQLVKTPHPPNTNNSGHQTTTNHTPP